MGRHKLPTKIKEAQGTLEKSRQVSNEMQVSSVTSMPVAPVFLNEYGVAEWHKVTNQLYELDMLHDVDLALLSAYCREMGTYMELAAATPVGGMVERTFDKDGRLRASKAKPEVRLMRESLDRALKLATQFGLTPSARASISAPVKEDDNKGEFDFFG